MAGGAGSRTLTAPPTVRVGIVSWNTADLLDDCLRALPDAIEGCDAHVVVVDNASDDESVAVARRHDVEVIANPDNRGYAVAMNQALAGDDDVLIALNPDTVCPPGSLTALVDRLLAEPTAGLVVPRLVHVDGRHQHSAYRLPTAAVLVAAGCAIASVRRGRIGQHFLLEGSGPHRDGPVDWAIGAVHVIRRRALAGEAPYSERSFMYAEDLELCWRLGQRSHPTVLDADVSIPHVGNAAGAQAWGSSRSERYWRATYDVIAQRRGPLGARVVAGGAVIAVLVALARAAVRARRRGPADAIAAETAMRRRELRVHARVVVSGAPPPPTAPPLAAADAASVSYPGTLAPPNPTENR